MALSKNQKEQSLTDLQERFKNAKSVFFSAYRGLSVGDISTMRDELRDSGASMVVAKKTLARLAAKESGVAEIPEEALPGPVAFVFSEEDEVAPAKVIKKWAKAKKDSVSIVGAVFEGKVLDEIQAKAIADIPSREELLAKLVGSLKSPISGFVRSLKSPASGFTNIIRELAQKG